jgi:hypothetical protein
MAMFGSVQAAASDIQQLARDPFCREHM